MGPRRPTTPTASDDTGSAHHRTGEVLRLRNDRPAGERHSSLPAVVTDFLCFGTPENWESACARELEVPPPFAPDVRMSGLVPPSGVGARLVQRLIVVEARDGFGEQRGDRADFDRRGRVLMGDSVGHHDAT